MAGDVLEETPFRLDLTDDPGDIGPKVAGVLGALAMTGEGEGLARISGSDDMNAAAPRSAVKGSQIVPYRRWSQGRVRHPRHETGRGETVSLDKAHSAISRFGNVQSEVEAANAGAQAEPAQFIRSLGIWSHM